MTSENRTAWLLLLIIVLLAVQSFLLLRPGPNENREIARLEADVRRLEREAVLANDFVTDLIEYNAIVKAIRDHYKDKWDKQEKIGRYAPVVDE